jgi:hypothetical protein
MKLWILDMYVMNHMIGSRAAFIVLNISMRGTMRFRDDSMVEIEG